MQCPDDVGGVVNAHAPVPVAIKTCPAMPVGNVLPLGNVLLSGRRDYDAAAIGGLDADAARQAPYGACVIDRH